MPNNDLKAIASIILLGALQVIVSIVLLFLYAGVIWYICDTSSFLPDIPFEGCVSSLVVLYFLTRFVKFVAKQE